MESENDINEFEKSIDIGVLMNTNLIAKIFQAITDFREENPLIMTIVNLTTLMHPKHDNLMLIMFCTC